MPRTIQIENSDEVMAMFGIPGHFYRGKWQNVRVTQVSPDEDTPLDVRKSLVGLIIPTILTKENIEGQTGATLPIPENSRLAYACDVVEVLKSSGKQEAAEQLRKTVPNPLDMYVLEDGVYELV